MVNASTEHFLRVMQKFIIFGVMIVAINIILSRPASCANLEDFLSQFGQKKLGGKTIKFSGSVKRGEAFTKEFFPNIFFQLQPDDQGWIIVIKRNTALQDDYSLFTLPLRFANPRYISTAYGIPAKEAVGYTRRKFNFVVNTVDYQKARAAWEKLLWPNGATEKELEKTYDALLETPMGHGAVVIKKGQTAGGSENNLGTIERIVFRVELDLPKEYDQLQSGRFRWGVAGKTNRSRPSHAPARSRTFEDFLQDRKNELSKDNLAADLEDIYLAHFKPGGPQVLLLWHVKDPGSVLAEDSQLDILAPGSSGWELRGAARYDHDVRFEGHTGEDINKDGIREIVLSHATGGNCWDCAYLDVERFNNDLSALDTVPTVKPEHIVFSALRDINGDGIDELIAVNTRWEFGFGLCHACSPANEAVYSYKDGHYVDDSRNYPGFFEEEITRLKKDLPREKDDQYYLGGVISLFLNYNQMGRTDEGWKVLNEHLTKFHFQQEWEARIPTIKKELEEKYPGCLPKSRP